VIPGTHGKPSLLKAGAEKLLSLFNLGATEPIIKEKELPEGHREYLVTINVIHYPTSRLVGTGIGLCTTMEKKYRYRNVADFEITGEVIPDDAKEKKQEYRKQGYGMRLIEGEWQWVRYSDEEASENPDIADMYNTVLKMAHKRSLVAAALVVTGASDIFTQDVEDFQDLGGRPVGLGAPGEPPAGSVEKPKAPPQRVSKYATARKAEVVEGVEMWSEVEVDDVEEKKLPDGKPYFIVKFTNGKSCGTINKDLGYKAAELNGPTNAEVRPGKRPGTFVLNKIETATQEE
jgi:hypothetical protein